MATAFFQVIARGMPNLRYNLKKAGMNYKPEQFIKRTFLSAFYMATGIIVFLALILAKFNALRGIMLLFIPIIFFMFFTYMLKYPEVRISKQEKEISKEIIFAGRHLIIELESGVPLYNGMINIARNYQVVGKYFKDITDKVNLGVSIEEALNDAIEFVPSDDFRRLLWQILNSIRTGSDISKSLLAVLDQIAREQIIEVDKYSKKLNPLAMFYMIIAVILPTLGITMLIILSSFIAFEISLVVFMVIALMLGFIQFMFLSLIKFSRPAVEL